MPKKIFIISAIFSLLLSACPALAVANRVPAAVMPSGRTVLIPERAIRVAEHIYSLGAAIDPASGEEVEGFAVLHPRERFAKANKPARPAPAPKCYGYLASGAKWKIIEPWVVNASNIRGLSEEFVLNNLASDIAKWENAADGADILGTGAATSSFLSADTVAPDNQNEVYFGEIADEGTIAITIIWGVFSGPASGRKLVEWDQVYDQVDFDWSSIGEAGKMDFENIATHELGHSVGMNDQYDSRCSEQTMYGYADFGETKKQTLESADIAGVNNLY